MSCRLCLQDRKLVKSHVIPEAFWRELRDENEGSPWMIAGSEGVFARRLHIGVYDEGILCEDCERKFGGVDDYGIRVLLKDFERLFAPVWDTTFPPRVVGFESGAIDQDRLLRFLVSVLWRASVSSHVFYRHINLGDLEARASTAINLDVPIPPVFGAVLARWTPAEAMGYAAHGILDPRPMTMLDTPVYIVYFGQSVAYLRASETPFSEKLAANRLGADEQARVIVRDFARSSELKAMVHTGSLSLQRDEQAAEGRRLRKARPSSS